MNGLCGLFNVQIYWKINLSKTGVLFKRVQILLMISTLKKSFRKITHFIFNKILATKIGKVFFDFYSIFLWSGFERRQPLLREYLKPYKNPRELVNKLASQGLQVSNKKNAEVVIFRENYFRFKAYIIPFFDNTKDQFHAGTSFDDVYQLYCADQKLRDFLMPLLARLEVRIRATVDNVITGITHDPFWHLNHEYFKDFRDVERALSKAQQRFNVGKQEFVVHYRTKYYTKRSWAHKCTPPFWIISEIFTLEQLLSICKSLKENHPKFSISAGRNELEKVALPFGLTSYSNLITNLNCILELRNLCAHHSRLWNRNLLAPAGLKNKMSVRASIPNRLYSQLVMLRILCKSQGINDGIENFMVNIFGVVPVFVRDMGSMGFPVNWRTDNVWK